MPLNQSQLFQPNWLVLSSNMADIGADGVGGVAAGVCRFIAPVRCRVRRVAIGIQAAVAAANGIRVDCAAGIIGDDQDQRSNEIPINTGTNTGFLCTGFDDRNNLLEAGQMFRVKSDGASGASIRAGVTVVIEPVGPVGWAGSLFCLSGAFPNGTGVVGHNYSSIPGGYEVLAGWAGLAATIATQANSIRLLKNGSGATAIGADLVLTPGGNDLTVFPDLTMHADVDRFVRPEDYLQLVTSPGGANFTSEIPYTLLCRRMT